MSKASFEKAVQTERLSRDNKVWFPRWIGRYAAFLKCNRDTLLPVDRDGVISFLRMLRDRSVPAWQRLQAVEAIECYQSVVRGEAASSLKDVRMKLIELAQREHNSGVASLEAQDVGRIDAEEPNVLQETRKSLRRMHYSRRTERAYVGWIQRFRSAHPGRDLANLGENEIKEFLGDLATRGEVAASTQNQALCALLFLYQKVLGRKLEFMEYIRAERPERLPVVLSQAEVRSPAERRPKGTPCSPCGRVARTDQRDGSGNVRRTPASIGPRPSQCLREGHPSRLTDCSMRSSGCFSLRD